jgi:AraC-like DNA-binding protein
MNKTNTSVYYETMHLSDQEEVVAYTGHSTGNYVVSHWHDAVEIIYIRNGDLTVSISGKDYELHEDMFILVNSKVIHANQCFRYNDAFVLQLPDRFLLRNIPEMENSMFQVPFITFSSEEQNKLARVKQVLRDMYLLYELQPDGMKLRFHSLLYELLYCLYQDFRVQALKSDFLKHTKNLNLLKKVMNYSEEHHSDQISIDEIAQIIGLQPKYFCRFFKNNVGQTYLYYLNELRISYIYQDLVNTDMPVYQIIEKHGFTNYKLFRRMFQERFHCTPGKIRR